jgi:hypothetical protein
MITEVAKVEANAGDRLIALAIEHGADVDKLEKLIALKNQEEERAAKKEFDIHFTDMQAEFTAVAKSKQGHGYKYAPIEVLQKHYNEGITSHGFSYRWREEAVDTGKRCIMRISGWGHAEENSFDIPKLQGTNRMNDVQAAGAMSTYGRRYTFVAGFGVIIEDEDDDTGSIPPPDQRKVKEVKADNLMGGDMRKGKEEIEKLIETYEPLVSPDVIDMARLNMEGAKTVGELRAAYVDLSDAGKAIEKGEQKERTKNYIDKVNAGVVGEGNPLGEPDDHADEIEAELEKENELDIF